MNDKFIFKIDSRELEKLMIFMLTIKSVLA